MTYPMTPERAKRYKKFFELFAQLSPAGQEDYLKSMRKRSLTVTSGTAEPVAAERPTLRIVKAPATGRG